MRSLSETVSCYLEIIEKKIFKRCCYKIRVESLLISAPPQDTWVKISVTLHLPVAFKHDVSLRLELRMGFQHFSSYIILGSVAYLKCR